MNNEKIVEFVTTYGITYVGEYLGEEIIDNITYGKFKDLLSVVMRPVKIKDSDKYDMAPSFDVINIFSDGLFKFCSSEIVYFSEIDSRNFKTLYSNTLKMWKDAREMNAVASDEQIGVSIKN